MTINDVLCADMTERLNKFLARHGVCSRREADRLIEAGRVLVNGAAAQVGDQVSEQDDIEVDGLPLDQPDKKIYILLNKPIGIMCTADHSKPDNVIDFVGLSERIFPVGRLDVESSGLLLLTNDGELANRLMHPRYEHEKEYEVHTVNTITDEHIKQLRQGVQLPDGLTPPTPVRRVGTNRMRIVLRQGRNRQIRRMCDAVGLDVKHLHRTRLHTLELGRMKSGQWRELSNKEIKALTS